MAMLGSILFAFFVALGTKDFRSGEKSTKRTTDENIVSSPEKPNIETSTPKLKAELVTPKSPLSDEEIQILKIKTKIESKKAWILLRLNSRRVRHRNTSAGISQGGECFNI